MNVIVASSRGGGLEGILRRLGHKNFTMDVTPGGRLAKLTDKAINLLPPPGSYTHPPHAYIIAGIPDITEQYKSHSYKECLYTEDPDKTLTRITHEITHCAEKIKEAGAIPCFCTITASNIQMYNQHLWKYYHTDSLRHTQYYEDMQTRLHTAIDNINAFIVKLNSENKMSTPMLHTAIKKRLGKAPKGYYIHKWDGLKDGVHGSEETKDKWATSLQVAIKKNRTKPTTPSDEETLSPKRSWRQEKNPKRQRRF